MAPHRPAELATDPAVRKYLDRHAEPGDTSWPDLQGSWGAVAVIPSCREGETPVDALLSLDAAACFLGGRALIILVVNARASAPTATHESNAATVARVRRMGPLRSIAQDAELIAQGHSDILLIDRAAEGMRFPEKQGVGLARKTGCDIALELIVGGQVTTPWIHTTDADAIVPTAYFAPAHSRSSTEGIAALALPFRHHFPPGTAFGQAQALYELSLRYFVLGLRHARSPYAFHTIGSTMAIDAKSYAQVRGFPRKEAGEDFYLLNKLAKVGGVATVGDAAIELKARPSDRVPFGTGVGVTRIERESSSGTPFRLYHPATFTWLRDLMDVLQDFATSGDPTPQREALIGSHWGAQGTRVLEELGLFDTLQDAADNTRSASARLKRVHTAFDAFRTRKTVHALRDSLLPPLPWREALASAPFLPDLSDTDSAAPSALCAELAGLESRDCPVISRPGHLQR